MRLSRNSSLISLFSYVASVLVTFMLLLTMASTTRESVGDSEIIIDMQPRIVMPGNCATVHWSFTNTRFQNLDGNEIPSHGSELFCPLKPLRREFYVVTDDGSSYQFFTFIGIFPHGTRIQFGILAALTGFGVWVVFVALVGDLPLLSPTARRVGHGLRLVMSKQLVGWRLRLWLRLVLFVRSRDAFAITVLGFLLILPLILARFSPRFNTPAVLVIGVGGAVSVAAWWLIRSHQRQHQPMRATQVQGLNGQLIVSGVFLFCTVAGYFLPMQHQFWGGGDEISVLQHATRSWDSFQEYDLRYGRPLTPLGYRLAGNLTDTGVDGYVWIATALRLLTGTLVYGVVRHLLPRNGALAMVAAVLFFVSPTEGSRFLAVYMQGYMIPLLFTLLALLLYLRSLVRENRVLLLLACIVLAMGLLGVEVTYLIALFIPLLLILRYRKHPCLPTWLFAWFVTMSLFALRFLIFLLLNRGSNYQLDIASGGSPLEGLAAQLMPTMEYLRIVGASTAQWLYGGLVAVVVMMGVLYVFRQQSVALTSRQWIVSSVVCAVGLLMAIVPYVSLPLDSVLSDRFRTQYFAAPFQALLWSLVLAGVVIIFFKASMRRWLVGAMGILVALATVNNLTADARRNFNPATSYERVAHFVEQVRALAPGFVPGTFLIYVLDEGITSPIGWNYSVFMLSQSTLGAPGVIVGTADQIGATYQFIDLETISNNWAISVDATQMVLFGVDANANVRLLETIPARITQNADELAFFQSVYAPTKRIVTTPFESETLRFFVDH
jgi:hypothetical protein